MKINIGSKNKVKIEALSETLKEYSDFEVSEIFPIEVDSGVSPQPKSLDEAVDGAIKRAKKAFATCEYSFGIESGLMKVPQTKTGYMDVTCCAIFDGKAVHLGLSSAFEFPPAVTKYIFEKDSNASVACHELGLTKSEYIGYEEGIIGILTKNKVTRKDYTKGAIRMALLQLQNKELYEIQ
jgi:inosine/xanthosine triphosphatase